jgi:CBS domain-containing protein
MRVFEEAAMKMARDVMVPPIVVSAETRVKELAHVLLNEHLDGVCVVDEAEELLGVVTSMDLIYQEKRLHLPTFFVLFDSVVPLEDPRKTEHELQKIAGRTVREVMTSPAVTVTESTPLDKVASLMVEQHISVVPVVSERRVVGVVTKPGMLEAAFGGEAVEEPLSRE